MKKIINMTLLVVLFVSMNNFLHIFEAKAEDIPLNAKLEIYPNHSFVVKSQYNSTWTLEDGVLIYDDILLTKYGFDGAIKWKIQLNSNISPEVKILSNGNLIIFSGGYYFNQTQIQIFNNIDGKVKYSLSMANVVNELTGINNIPKSIYNNHLEGIFQDGSFLISSEDSYVDQIGLRHFSHYFSKFNFEGKIQWYNKLNTTMNIKTESPASIFALSGGDNSGDIRIYKIDKNTGNMVYNDFNLSTSSIQTVFEHLLYYDNKLYVGGTCIKKDAYGPVGNEGIFIGTLNTTLTNLEINSFSSSKFPSDFSTYLTTNQIDIYQPQSGFVINGLSIFGDNVCLTAQAVYNDSNNYPLVFKPLVVIFDRNINCKYIVDLKSTNTSYRENQINNYSDKYITYSSVDYIQQNSIINYYDLKNSIIKTSIDNFQYTAFSQLVKNSLSNTITNTYLSNKILSTQSDYTKPIWDTANSKTWGDFYNSTISDWILLRVDNQLSTNGFLGAAFVNVNTKKIVVAFNSTEDIANYNWADELLFSTQSDTFPYDWQRRLNKQLELANKFYNSVTTLTEYSDYQISTTGHSFGGTLASYVALKNDIEAKIFSAPSITSQLLSTGVFDIQYGSLFNAHINDNIEPEKYWFDASPEEKCKYLNITSVPFHGIDVQKIENHVNESDSIIQNSWNSKKWKNIDNTIKHTDGAPFLSDIFGDGLIRHGISSYLAYDSQGFHLTTQKGDTQNDYKSTLQNYTVTSKYSFKADAGYIGDIILGNSRGTTLSSGSLLGYGDYIYGGDGSDTLTGSNNDDFIIGGKGNDQLQGVGGDDIYLINKGDGIDTIKGTLGRDVIVFGSGIILNDIKIYGNSGAENSFVLQYTDNDSISIPNNAIRGLYFADAKQYYNFDCVLSYYFNSKVQKLTNASENQYWAGYNLFYETSLVDGDGNIPLLNKLATFLSADNQADVIKNKLIGAELSELENIVFDIAKVEEQSCKSEQAQKMVDLASTALDTAKVTGMLTKVLKSDSEEQYSTLYNILKNFSDVEFDQWWNSPVANEMIDSRILNRYSNQTTSAYRNFKEMLLKKSQTNLTSQVFCNEMNELYFVCDDTDVVPAVEKALKTASATLDIIGIGEKSYLEAKKCEEINKQVIQRLHTLSDDISNVEMKTKINNVIQKLNNDFQTNLIIALVANSVNGVADKLIDTAIEKLFPTSILVSIKIGGIISNATLNSNDILSIDYKIVACKRLKDELRDSIMGKMDTIDYDGTSSQKIAILTSIMNYYDIDKQGALNYQQLIEKMDSALVSNIMDAMNKGVDQYATAKYYASQDLLHIDIAKNTASNYLDALQSIISTVPNPTPIPRYKISGYVKDSVSGLALPNASVVLNASSGLPWSKTTDANGYYEFTGVVASTHEVSVSNMGYVAYQSFVTITNADSSKDINLIQITYKISGYVKNSITGLGLANVQVLLNASSGVPWSQTTDSNGYYEFTGVVASTHQISVSLSGYIAYNNTVTVDNTDATKSIDLVEIETKISLTSTVVWNNQNGTSVLNIGGASKINVSFQLTNNTNEGKIINAVIACYGNNNKLLRLVNSKVDFSANSSKDVSLDMALTGLSGVKSLKLMLLDNLSRLQPIEIAKELPY